MLNAKATQFSLSPAGEILWQEKLNNPLPGVPVAKLIKGDHPLRPLIGIIPGEETAKVDENLLKGTLSLWLNGHLQTVLEPLMMLSVGVPDGTVPAEDDQVAQIAKAVFDGLGIVPRENIEGVISKLDVEKRTALRAKKIRLGPILVFIPALNKPAAVRLRSVLWCLFQGVSQPEQFPADGIVSFKVSEDVQHDPAFYRAVGYPLFGGRAIRIDMLDRVISCVYDNAKDGKFQAKHEMAEWLGTSIENLYCILSDMGHVKIFDPAEEKAKAEQENAAAADVVPAEENPVVQAELVVPEITAVAAASENNTEETSPEKPAEEKPVQKKPELAVFRLKRGKAFVRNGNAGGQKNPRREFVKKDKPEAVVGGAPFDRSKKEHHDKKFKDKKHKDHKREGKKSFDDSPRVISYEVKKRQEDSPFAILQQLKKSDG